VPELERLITGEGVPDATMVDLEAATGLLLVDRAITEAMALESLRRFAASAERFLDVFPTWGRCGPGG